MTLQKIRNAGEILLGHYTPIPTANYCLGLNAILPTGGFARSFSSVSVWDFLKRSGHRLSLARGVRAFARDHDNAGGLRRLPGARDGDSQAQRNPRRVGMGSDLLQRMQALQFSDKAAAETLLLEFLRANYPFSATQWQSNCARWRYRSIRSTAS